MEIEKKPLGVQLKEARLAAKLTQDELAENTKLSKNLISAMENDHPKARNPTWFVLKELQKALKIKFDIWD